MEREIIATFAKEYGREFTILQLSKELKKSYGSVYNHTKRMIKDGMINSRVIGSSILCALNYDNNIVIGYLILNSIINAQKNQAPAWADSTDISIQIGKKQYYTGRKIKANAKHVDNITLKKIALKKLGEVNVLKGHEMFWNLIK